MIENNSLDIIEKNLPDREGAENESGVGPLLKAARMRVGSELEEIAIALRIRYPYLRAIEENRYDELPGAAYTVGFIRSYAEHLGLDSAEIVRRYKLEHSSLREKQKLIFPTPITENRIPGLMTILFGSIFVFLSYGSWHLSKNDESFFSAMF